MACQWASSWQPPQIAWESLKWEEVLLQSTLLNCAGLCERWNTWLGVLVQYYHWGLTTTYCYSKSRILNNCLHWAFLCWASWSFKLKLMARKWAQQSPIIIMIMATCWVSNSWEKNLVSMIKAWTCKVSFSTDIGYSSLHCKWASSYELGCLSNSLHHLGLTWVALMWLLQVLFFLLVLSDGPWLHFTQAPKFEDISRKSKKKNI